MSAEEIMINANINQTLDNNRAPNVFITQVGGNPAHGTTTTLVTGNQTPNAATTPSCSEALFARPPHIMDQDESLEAISRQLARHDGLQ
ncbi:hypothetical protein D8674_000103 [Pyrus ussuriensis x Pyrus communis]|uniref:Uncharacterized protein n=1 Tax=Pyrus ussuriensis x Pyrus communis TaxID=2448454 RepID=A0A5N5F333_9ROSA|nr:hypothetical protein D8674_000103 [Pyrus ussuriensis x Pyrus communis]